MGASEWYYFVRFEATVESTLERVRDQVFAEGRYWLRPWETATPKSFEETYGNLLLMYGPKAAELEAILRESYAAEQERVRLSKPPFEGRPSSVEMLHEWNGEDGTHSILDMDRVADSPELGAVAPLPDQELLELYGTLRPDRTQVESQLRAVTSCRARERGVYVLIYGGADTPEEVLFCGWSGD